MPTHDPIPDSSLQLNPEEVEELLDKAMAIRVRMGTRVQDPSHYLAAVEQVEEQARNGRVNPRWVRWVDLVLEAEGITEELL